MAEQLVPSLTTYGTRREFCVPSGTTTASNHQGVSLSQHHDLFPDSGHLTPADPELSEGLLDRSAQHARHLDQCAPVNI